MAKTIKFGNVVLCEYVAEGSHNKHTLVNAYSGDVVVKEMPAQINFGLYIEILPLGGVSKIEVELLLNNEIKAKIGAELKDARKDQIGLVVLPSFRIKTEEDAILEVYINADGYKRTIALRRKIFRGEIPEL